MKTCTVVQCVHAFKLEPVYLTSSRTFLKWNQNLEDFKNWIPWNSQNVFSSKDQCQQHLTEMLTRVSPFPSTGIFWADCSKHENSKTLKCFPMSNWKLPRGSFCSSLLFSTHALTLVLTKRYQLKALKVASIGISLEYHLLGIFQSCNEPKGFLLSGEAAADWFPMFFTQRKNSNSGSGQGQLEYQRLPQLSQHFLLLAIQQEWVINILAILSEIFSVILTLRRLTPG